MLSEMELASPSLCFRFQTQLTVLSERKADVLWLKESCYRQVELWHEVGALVGPAQKPISVQTGHIQQSQ